MLQDADIVFWIGEDLESFLETPLESIAKDAKQVTLMESEDIELLKFREKNVFDDHDDHGDEHDEHDQQDDHDDHEEQKEKEEHHDLEEHVEDDGPSTHSVKGSSRSKKDGGPVSNETEVIKFNSNPKKINFFSAY